MDETILAKLYKYCAYQDRCTSEVEQKLVEHEVPPPEQAAYLTHLEAERFLDDARFAHNFVRGKHRYKGWGRVKLQYELRQRGLPTPLIEQALRAELEPVAYQQTLAELAQRKWAQWQQEAPLARKQKTARFLSQRGYTWAEFGPILDELSE